MSGDKPETGTIRDESAAPIGYAAAMSELEAILERLDDDRLDIDQLGDEVARAADLIAACRARLDAARLRVNEIVADLDDTP